MLYTELTKKAMRICFEAHRGQTDKGGVPYVFHPFHVAEQMQTEEETCAALLHDVVEDTDLTLQMLAAEGFPPAVTDALALLTHDEGTPYLEYVARLKADPVAAAVKLADLRHNSTPGRLPRLREKDVDRIRKYLRAQAILTGGTADLENMCLRVEIAGEQDASPGMEMPVERNACPRPEVPAVSDGAGTGRSAAAPDGAGTARGAELPDGAASPARSVRRILVLNPDGTLRGIEQAGD